MGWWTSLVAKLSKNTLKRRAIRQARDEAEAMEHARREFAKRYPKLVEPRDGSNRSEDGDE